MTGRGVGNYGRGMEGGMHFGACKTYQNQGFFIQFNFSDFLGKTFLRNKQYAAIYLELPAIPMKSFENIDEIAIKKKA